MFFAFYKTNHYISSYSLFLLMANITYKIINNQFLYVQLAIWQILTLKETSCSIELKSIYSSNLEMEVLGSASVLGFKRMESNHP